MNVKLSLWQERRVSRISTLVVPFLRIPLGMALSPWAVMGGGKFRTDEEEERRRETGEQGRKVFNDEWERNESERKISRALENVAKEVGVESLTSGAVF